MLRRRVPSRLNGIPKIILCSVVGGEFRHLRKRARVAGRAHLEEVRGTGIRTFIIVKARSDGDDTVADRNGITKIITICSIVGGEFRHLRPRARVVGRALLEEVRHQIENLYRQCSTTAISSLIVRITELIIPAPSLATSFANCVTMDASVSSARTRKTVATQSVAIQRINNRLVVVNIF